MSTRLYVSTNEATFFNTNVMGCSSSPPSEGSYIIGDFYISTVQQQGVFGWVCVESGTPGVWKDICNIGDVNESIKQNQNNIEDLRARVVAAEAIVKDLELSAGVDVFALEKTVNEAVRNINNHEEDIVYLKSIDTEIKSTVTNTQNIANINKDNIATLTTQVGLNDRDIDVLKAADNDLKSSISNTQNIANINKDNIASLTTQVGINDKDIDNIRNLVNGLSTELNGLKSDLNLSDGDITGIRDQISAINNSLNVIDVKLNRAVNDIDVLENNFTNLTGSGIQDISKAINDNKNNITNIEKNITTINNNVATLTKDISDNNTIMATLNTRVDGYATNVVDLLNRVNNSASEIEKLKTQDINHGTDINNLKHQHTRQELDIQNITNELAELSTSIEGLESTLNLSGTDIQDLGKAVVEHEKDIENINNNITQVNTLINTTISDRISKNETDIASIRGSVNSLNSSLGLVDSMVQNATTINNTVMENKQKIDALIQKHDDDIENFVTNEVFDNFKTEYNESNEGFDSRLDDLETTVNTNYKTDLQNLKNKDTQIDGDINEIKESIKTNNDANTEAVSNLNEQVEGLSDKVDGIDNDVQDLTKRLVSLEESDDANTEAISNLNEQVEGLSELPDKVDGIDNDVQELTDIVMDDITNLADLKTAFVEVLNLKDCEVTINNSWKELFMCLIGITNVIEYPCTHISLNNTNIEFNEIGQVQLLQASILPENTTDKITWLSTNTNVVKVNEGGVVIAVGSGECIIYASCGDKKAQCNVNVNVNIHECSGIALDTSKLTLYATGDKYTLIPTINPEGCTDPIYWSSSNINVATVDSSGLVNPINPGFTTITAKCGNYAATCQVTVNTRHVCTDLSFSVESVTIGLGTTKYYLAQYLNVRPLVCTDTVYWSSSNIDVATIDENGFVTAKGIVGTTRITVNCGDIETSILFIVEGSDTPVEPK